RRGIAISVRRAAVARGAGATHAGHVVEVENPRPERGTREGERSRITGAFVAAWQRLFELELQGQPIEAELRHPSDRDRPGPAVAAQLADLEYPVADAGVRGHEPADPVVRSETGIAIAIRLARRTVRGVGCAAGRWAHAADTVAGTAAAVAVAVDTARPPDHPGTTDLVWALHAAA